MGNELILLKKIAKFWNQQDWFDRPDGALIVTNRRLIFRNSTIFQAFTWEVLENLGTRRVLLVSPALQFDVAGQTYVFTFLWNAEAVLNAIAAAQQEINQI